MLVGFDRWFVTSLAQIYNEQIRDLLAPVTAAAAAPKYEIKHERSGAVYVTDLLQVPVQEAHQVRLVFVLGCCVLRSDSWLQ
jgi:hypothetical protein